MAAETNDNNSVCRTQARNIIYNVYKFMEKESIEGVKNIQKVESRTSRATQVSINTIKRIRNEGDTGDTIKTPGRSKSKHNPVTGLDDVAKGVVRRLIFNFHLTNKELPTLSKLLVKLKREVGFKGSDTSLRRLLYELHFRWHNTNCRNKALLEKSSHRLQRINYLQQIKEYKEQNRTIVYVGSCCIDRTFKYQSKGIKLKRSYKTDRVFIVHAGSKDGLIQNAFAIFMSDADVTKSDLLKFETYNNWFCTRLLPNLPQDSVIVLDNTPHHNKEIESAPLRNSNKIDMQRWLTSKNIPFSPDMYKPQLYQLIKANKDRFRKYYFDEIVLQHGHDVVRLPPGHADLNPVNLVFIAIKKHVSANVADWDNISVMESVRGKMDIMTYYQWRQLYNKVEKFEEEYKKCDIVVDQLTNDIIITENESGADESEIDDESSSDDEDIIYSTGCSSARSTPVSVPKATVSNIGLYHFVDSETSMDVSSEK